MGYQLIEKVTVGSGGVASIEFTAIPQDATDLVLLLSGRNTVAGSGMGMKLELNGIATGYTAKRLLTDGSSVYNDSSHGYVMTANTAVANNFSSTKFFFFNYTSSLAKDFTIDALNVNNTTDAYQMIVAGTSAATAAITSIKTFGNSGNFMEYTVASLYKVS
tara:strand:+ start:1507 stop:1992 length:486 start_codon:yes stop_codon:yes gene_type:complete